MIPALDPKSKILCIYLHVFASEKRTLPDLNIMGFIAQPRSRHRGVDDTFS